MVFGTLQVPLATASEAAVKVLLDFDKDHDR